jgi:hypothetical protein
MQYLTLGLVWFVLSVSFALTFGHLANIQRRR